MLPADQGLGADQLPVSIHLGLVVQDKVVLVEALAQVAFQAGAGADFGLHRRVEKAQRVAAGSFGLVHGHVGTLEYLVDRTVLHGEQGDADAGRADIAAALQGVGHGERLNDLVADVFNLLAGLFRLQAQAFEHQHKLIAAETSQGVLGAHMATQAFGDLLQQLVAHVVAKGVVEVFEIVQVDKQQCALLQAAGMLGQGLLQAVEQ